MSTTYSPRNTNEFSSKCLNFDGIGINGTAIANTTTSIDYLITQDVLITGAILLTKNSKFGDNFIFQVVDIDGILSPSGTILNQFITNWYVSEDIQKQLDMQINYPAKLYAGLYLRFMYTSIGDEDVSVAINYTLHKVLI